nr:LOW QUALITY PROTEIN: uncharacterized protein LOC124492617 [Dermatophagoides farinae]
MMMIMNSSEDLGPFFRISFLSIVFILNFFTLFHLLFRYDNNGHHYRSCIHLTNFVLNLLLVNVFISIWIPYLFSSFFYKTIWPMINIEWHCMIQQTAPLMISTFLFVSFCFQKIYETFIAKRANIICMFIFLIWILPQTIYLLLTQLTSIHQYEYYFIDRRRNHSMMMMMDDDDDDEEEHGILLCIDKLDSWNIRQMSWHYVTIIVPLTSLYIICIGAKRFSKTFTNTNHLINVNCDCRFDTIVFICQYSNFIWLLLFRPLLTLSALIHYGKTFQQIHNHDDESSSQFEPEIRSLTMDLGQQIILLFFAIFLPFSQHFGLFSLRSNRHLLQESSLRRKMII